MQYINTVKDSSKSTRLIPFVFSRDESYVLEFGDLYIRFYTDGAQVTSGGSVYEIASPWSQTEIWDLHFAQANDVMYIVHSAFKPRKLSRTGAASWTLATPSLTGAPWDGNSDGHADGFPLTTVFFEQRLWFGGRAKDPQTLYASKAADFEEFTIPASPAADDPLELVLASNRQEKIQWLHSGRVLIIGTSGGEHRLLPNQYLSSSNLPLASRMSSYGGRHIQPEQMGRFTVFVQGSGRQVRTYEQRAASNIELYDSDDLSWLSEHVTTSGIISMSYQLYPYISFGA